VITKQKYYEIFNDAKRAFLDITGCFERIKYIENLINEATNGDENELKNLFEIGQDEGHIAKKVKYSRDNLIESLIMAITSLLV